MFFRDTSLFDTLRQQLLPTLIGTRKNLSSKRQLRFWCAGCSSGQEPYSLAILLTELIPNLTEWDIQILASDISDAALQQASRGWYAPHEIHRGLSDEQIQRYFSSHQGGWKIRDELRGMVAFRRINLLAPLTGMSAFDMIFCRNVAIYFSQDDRHRLFTRVLDLLGQDGVIFVGSSESLTDMHPRVEAINEGRCTYYQRPTDRAHLTPPEPKGVWQPEWKPES